MNYVPHCIFLSFALALLYTADIHLFDISKHFHYNLLSNASSTIVDILSESARMKTYDYEEDESNVIEYTESSVEAYFNAYLRLEQKYAMRPRYGIARAVYERNLRDEAIENFDKSTWYTCDTAKLSPELQALFTQLHLDEETQEFLDASSNKSNAVFTQLYHTVVKLLLSPFLCQTSINGLLRRGSMFVISSGQFERLLDASYLSRPGLRLIDLGAGDGATTSKMAPFFSRVYATEISAPMRWLLEKSGYTLLGLTEWQSHKYDVIACLNLLDRCDSPVQLLNEIKSALLPDGRLLIALSLPYAPYVESNTGHAPSEYLAIDSSSQGLEAQISQVVSRVLAPLGFQLVTWSKVPYLCEGDMRQAYYWLTDVLFVLRLQEEPVYS